MASNDRNTDAEQEMTDLLDELAGDEESWSDQNGWLADLRRRRTRARSFMESRRDSSRLIDTALHASERSARIPPSLLAGALASRFVVYAIPFLVLMIGATGLYSQAANAEPAEVARTAGMPGLLADAVQDSTDIATGLRVATVITMVFATLWAADSLGKLIRRTHALVWATPITKIRRRWAVPLGVIAASAGTMLITSLGMLAEDWSVPLVVGELVTEFIAVSLGWLLIAFLLPHDPEARPLTHLLPGALLVGLGVVGMKAAMVLYFVPRSITLTARYGDLASAIVLLTWAYWVAFIVVFSAELNAALFKSSQTRAP